MSTHLLDVLLFMIWDTVAVGVIKSVDKTEKAGKGELLITVCLRDWVTGCYLSLVVTKSAEKAAKKK